MSGDQLPSLDSDRITRLEERVSSVVARLDEINEGVKKLVSLETSIQLAVAAAGEQQRVVNAQWAKIDNLNSRMDQHDRFKSRIAGAIWAFGIVGVFAAASIVWLFQTVLVNREINAVQAHQIQQLIDISKVRQP